MKSIKFFALAIGAIALLPSVSLAGNVSGTSQEANLSSTTFGCGNVTVQDVQQRTMNLQNSQHPGTNVNGTALKVNADTTTIGNNNVDVKKAVQEAISIQQAH
jgi:hypothetical protein